MIYLKKKILGIVIILVVISIVIIKYVGVTGTFEEVILSQLQEEKFHKVSIIDKKDGYFQRKSKASEDLNNASSLFKDLEVKEVGSSSRLIQKIEKYSIYLYNDNTHESLYINILDENYLRIVFNTIEIEEDKINKITEHNNRNKTNYYEIINDKLDIDSIEKIFNNMESDK